MMACLLPWIAKLSEKGSTYVGKNWLLGSKFFPMKVDPHLEGSTYIGKNLLPGEQILFYKG